MIIYIYIYVKYIYISNIFFIQSSVDGHSDCFHLAIYNLQLAIVNNRFHLAIYNLQLAIVNNAAMNTGVHVFFWISVFLFVRYIPRVGISGSYGSSIFSFLSSCGFMGSFLTQDNITITIIILFDGILITNLASRNNSKLATIYSDTFPLIMKTFPILCTRFSSSLCTFHVPNCALSIFSHFSKEPEYLPVEDNI